MGKIVTDVYFEKVHTRVESLADPYSISELRKAYQWVESQYRQQGAVGALSSQVLAVAYAAVRLPATYRVLLRLLGDLDQFAMSFVPTTLIDLGTGPGSALLAANEFWPELTMHAVEREAAFASVARSLLGSKQAADVSWEIADFARLQIDRSFDIVVSSYALGELQGATRRRLLQQMVQCCEGYILVVEPGTPAGFESLLDVRSFLVDNGYRIVAPCGSQLKCPSSWCHFSLKLPRSKIHRVLKGGQLAYEFEHYCYVLATKTGHFRQVPSILEMPKISKSSVRFRVCKDGELCDIEVGRREQPHLYKRCKKMEWGDRFEG